MFFRGRFRSRILATQVTLVSIQGYRYDCGIEVIRLRSISKSAFIVVRKFEGVISKGLGIVWIIVRTEGNLPVDLRVKQEEMAIGCCQPLDRDGVHDYVQAGQDGTVSIVRVHSRVIAVFIGAGALSVITAKKAPNQVSTDGRARRGSRVMFGGIVTITLLILRGARTMPLVEGRGG